MSFQTKPLACIVCASNFTEHGIVGKHVCYIYTTSVLLAFVLPVPVK